MCYTDCKGVEVFEGDHYTCLHNGALCRRHVEDAWYVLSKERPSPGVYVLMNEGAAVYFGMSGNVWKRMREHIQQGKEWDSVFMSYTDTETEARTLERQLLESVPVLPKYNRSRTH